MEIILGIILIIIFLPFYIAWVILKWIVKISLDIYANQYFKSEPFLEMKSKVQKYIQDCNDLNKHIEYLKSAYDGIKRTNYGVAQVQNTSLWGYKKKALENLQQPSERIVFCSATVCKNAQNQPVKYFLKYFDIPSTEESLAKFEDTLNKFSAAEQGLNILIQRKEKLISKIESRVPKIIMKFRRAAFERALGFEDVDISMNFIPIYSFEYVSAGGNSSLSVPFALDIPNLEVLVNYLGERIKFRKSAAGQRALMTPKLREKIKERDHYTCRYCKNGTNREPNLLLEIDHIMPVSKGGLTTENNLQTLCWRCNRSKGAKITE